MIQIFIKNFTALAKKIRTADNIDNSYFILSDFKREPNEDAPTSKIPKVLFVREIQGLRSLKKRSILHVCEDFEGKHNAKVSHQKVLFVWEIQGLRSLKKRSILHVCEHFEGKHNAEVLHEKTFYSYRPLFRRSTSSRVRKRHWPRFRFFLVIPA